MKFIGIIPARAGSIGVKDKNTRHLNGKPLICYTIEAALNSNLNQVIVTTDCEKVIEIVKEYPVKIIQRPSELAKSTTSMIEVINHTFKKIDFSEFSFFMLLQPTSYLRTSNDINSSINLVLKNQNIDGLISVTEVPHSFNRVKQMTEIKGFLKGDEIIQRQKIDIGYSRNGAIYMHRNFKNFKSFLEGRIIKYLMPFNLSFDIDGERDWDLAEILIKHIKEI